LVSFQSSTNIIQFLLSTHLISCLAFLSSSDPVVFSLLSKLCIFCLLELVPLAPEFSVTFYSRLIFEVGWHQTDMLLNSVQDSLHVVTALDV